MNEELLTAKQLSKILKISLALAYKMADRGQIPCVRWECPSEKGGRKKTVVRFQREDVVRFVGQNYRKGVPRT